MILKKLAIVSFILFAFFYFRPVFAQDDGIILFTDSLNNVEISTGTSETAKNDVLASVPVQIVNNQENNLATETSETYSSWTGILENQTASGTISEATQVTQALSYFSYIIAIIAVTFVASYILQKKGFIRRNAYGKVLGILPLDTKRMIYITEIVGKYYILGVTEQSINKIDEINDKEMIKLIKLSDKKPESPNETFARMLKETGVNPTEKPKYEKKPSNEPQKIDKDDSNAKTDEQQEKKPADPAHIEALKALLSKK